MEYNFSMFLMRTVFRKMIQTFILKSIFLLLYLCKASFPIDSNRRNIENFRPYLSSYHCKNQYFRFFFIFKSSFSPLANKTEQFRKWQEVNKSTKNILTLSFSLICVDPDAFSYQALQPGNQFKCVFWSFVFFLFTNAFYPRWVSNFFFSQFD